MIADPPVVRWARRLLLPTLAMACLAGATCPAARAQDGKSEKKARKKDERREPQLFEKMNYGRFLTATIKAPQPGNNNAMKGVAIRVGSIHDKEGAVCFDPDLLRVSAGWTGGFLRLLGTPFDGGHGSWPEIRGSEIFGTRPAPGWAKGDNFDDPRSDPFGPIPADWAKYKGLYRHGDHVVLSYTVGKTAVLELPWIAGEGEEFPAITRTFNLAAASEPLMLVVADVEGATGGVGPLTKAEATDETGPANELATLLKGDKATWATVVGAPKGSTFKLMMDKSRIVLCLPASTTATTFTVVVGSGRKGENAKFAQLLTDEATKPVDLAKYTKGGPAKWTTPVTTKGKLGEGDGPYVVDTLTAPESNPYDSWMRFGGLDFFADGTKAALTTWSGDVWVVSGIDEKLEKLTWKRFATGLFQPLGLKIVRDEVYTLGRDGITKLVDVNHDGEADFYQAFNFDMAVTTGFHEFAMDLQTDAAGNFYFAKAAPVKGGGRGFDHIAANSGTVMKVSPDGSTLTNYAAGLRAPNGIGVGPDGQVTSGDNEGTWMPKCRLNWIKPGGFYGVVSTAHRDDSPTMYDEPICWFPKDVDNSSGGQVWVPSGGKWGPFEGRLLHTSYGTCSLYLALVDQQDGHIQGGVVRFPVNFLTGIMRPKFNPADGQLYVAGLKGWQTTAALDAAFQRVRSTGKPANMATGLKVTATGLDITFTDKLEAEDATDPESYEIEQWNYLWCSEYGSDDYSAKAPDYQAKVQELNRLRLNRGENQAAIETLTKSFRKGRDEVTVKAAKLSGDGKTVSLTVEGLKPVMQMRIRGKLKAADGKRVPLEIISTINYVPGSSAH